MLSTVTTHYLNNGTHQSPLVSMKCMQQSSLQTAGKLLRYRCESTFVDVNPQSNNPRITYACSHKVCKVRPATPDYSWAQDNLVEHDTCFWYAQYLRLNSSQAENCCTSKCLCTKLECGKNGHSYVSPHPCNAWLLAGFGLSGLSESLRLRLS